jgi:hypothetical protein
MNKKNLALMLATSFIMLTQHVQAEECVPLRQSNNGAEWVGKGDGGSWAVSTQQAANTWDDWIWRGPAFYCTATGKNTCSYMWGQTNTSGYSWSVGIKVDTKNLPILENLWPFDASGNYSRNVSYTQSFTWTQTISSGYYAQPVQVVRRRWHSGYFKGMDHRSGNKLCYTIMGETGYIYKWDGNATFGSWEGNQEESRFGMYYVHK